MSGVGAFWRWLSKPRTRAVLGFLGAGLAVVVGALWQVYLHFTPAAPPPGPATAPSANVDTAGVERLQASQKHALESEANALDKVAQQIDAAGNPPRPAPAAQH